MDQDRGWHGGRPQPKRLYVRWGPSPSPKGGGAPPQFSAHFYCGQTAGCIKMPLGIELGLSPGTLCNCVRRGPCPFLQKGGGAPQIFGPYLLWPNGWMDQDAPWYEGRPHPRGLCVRWGPSSPSPKRAYFYCGQTAGCIEMPLGMEVGLSAGDFMLDRDPVSLPKRGGAPQFSAHVYCDQTVAWIKMPLGTRHCVR